MSASIPEPYSDEWEKFVLRNLTKKQIVGIVRDLALELTVWRDGGVTEEILRRQDGYIKVGRGCAIVRASDLNIVKK